MGEHQEIDIKSFSYEEFVSFVFDHEVPSGQAKYHPWYFDVEVAFDPGRVCEFYIRLFRNPGFLLEKYSKPQLEKGFWAIHGAAFDCSAQHLIWDEDLPFALRSDCIRSMSVLFKQLFAREPLETTVFMWWDSLCYEWESGNKDRQRGGEDMLMQDVIFEVLADLLQGSSEVCQDAALHGLGHLHHPETKKLIKNYIEQRPLLTKERKEYALSAACFDIQ